MKHVRVDFNASLLTIKAHVDDPSRWVIYCINLIKGIISLKMKLTRPRVALNPYDFLLLLNTKADVQQNIKS